MDQAACKGVGTYIFFADRNDHKARAEAQMMCFSCPVRNACKEYRERTDSKYGIWAGKHHKPTDKE